MSGDPYPQPQQGEIRGAVHLFPLRIYFEDTDLAGIVYYANYLRFIERARSDLLRLLGVDQRAAADAGEGAYAVAEVHARYLAPARLDDALVIASRAAELGAASVRMDQTVLRDGQPIFRADVRVGFLTPDGRPRRHPAPWRAAFAQFAQAVAGHEPAAASHS